MCCSSFAREKKMNRWIFLLLPFGHFSIYKIIEICLKNWVYYHQKYPIKHFLFVRWPFCAVHLLLYHFIADFHAAFRYIHYILQMLIVKLNKMENMKKKKLFNTNFVVPRLKDWNRMINGRAIRFTLLPYILIKSILLLWINNGERKR